ncbi:MAG: tRNA pseudouridine synthase, partial [Clostridiales bacterium]|nr:tRNA pseudouridine synthase [Clostridiales bacterium]
IVVTNAEEVEERFHSQYNVVSKKYAYRIWNSKYHNPFLRKYTAHIHEPLNLDLMKSAAAYLIGEHDFTSFHSTRSQKKSSLRTIYSISIKTRTKGQLVEITCHGNGFLHNMVRIIAGTLIEVGTGRMTPEYVKEILENKDRTLAGPTAPSKGLFLQEIEY